MTSNVKQWRKNNPEKYLKQKWRYTLKKRYGLSIADYTLLHLKQHGRCAICDDIIINGYLNRDTKTNFQTCVDHNHVTGKVRGLLCWNCNVALGKFKDNPTILRKAADYLERG